MIRVVVTDGETTWRVRLPEGSTPEDFNDAFKTAGCDHIAIASGNGIRLRNSAPPGCGISADGNPKGDHEPEPR